MTMQRRHFEMIAETIKDLRREPAADQPTIEMVAREFARALARTNPRFDTERFVEATR